MQNEHVDRYRLDELVELMVDTVCSRWETIPIAGDDYPAEVVKSRFLKLDSSHVDEMLAFAEQAGREYEAELSGKAPEQFSDAVRRR